MNKKFKAIRKINNLFSNVHKIAEINDKISPLNIQLAFNHHRILL